MCIRDRVRAEQNRQRDAEQNRKLISELKQSVELLKNSNELLQAVSYTHLDVYKRQASRRYIGRDWEFER